MNVYRRPSLSFSSFLRRTVAAQIHVVALVFVWVGMAVLLPRARTAGAEHFWACLVFLVAGSLLFLTSSVYHFLHDGYAISSGLELFLEDLDHYCIYLFIAGTYTPFLFNAVENPWRTYLLVAIWTMAVLGIVYTKLKPFLFPVFRSRVVYTGLFVMMGWLLVVRIGEIYTRLSPHQLSLLMGGVLAYSVGAFFYLTKRPVLAAGIFGYHELWHLMVLLGASLHFFFIHSFYGFHP
jgi:hemolysin III